MVSENVKNLHISVVGAGMGGLTCALSLAKEGFTNINLYENAPGFGFVGAGLQLAPNMARVLDRLGCWDEVLQDAVEIQEISVRENPTDQSLATTSLRAIKQNFGYPHMVGHRASLAGALYNSCKKEPSIRFIWATTVQNVTFSPKPVFQAQASGKEPYRVETDILIGADGVKSRIRDQMMKVLGISSRIQDTGQACYRIMLTREQLQHDPELLALIDSRTVTRWIGEKRHIIAYPVSNHTIYNMSTAQPDTNFADAPSATYTTSGSKDKLLETYADFSPRVLRMLNLVPDGEIVEWKLCIHEKLPTWFYGSVALLGDACHPTLPHLAQGAAQAVEDAAVLAVALSSMKSRDDITKALEFYELMRKDRAETLVDLASEAGRVLHLGEGGAKKERDAQFAALRAGKSGQHPDKWASTDVQRMIYGYDCVQEARKKLEERQSKL